MRSKFAITIPTIPLILGCLLWFLYEIGFLYPGAGFGAGRWPDMPLCLLGTIICCISIPVLYKYIYADIQISGKAGLFSRTILLCLFFFFGIFFQLGSDLYFIAFGSFVLSVITVFTTHLYCLIHLFSNAVKNRTKSYVAHLFLLTVY